jgi:hypothetical protein
VCRPGHAARTIKANKKNGFQAAIPETLRSAARSRDNRRNRIASVHAGCSKSSRLEKLDTMYQRTEQKIESGTEKSREEGREIGMIEDWEGSKADGVKCLPQIVKAVTLVML